MKRLFKEYILKNWNLKLIAILLTLILWLFVRAEPGPERVVAVPLEVQLPSNMEITSERPSTIDVTLRGPAFSNMLFNQPLPTCIVDLQSANEGEHTLMLTPANVSVPKGSRIEVLQVNPSRITLVLERTLSKEVPIVVPTQGKPAQGFEVYGITSKPDIMEVSGPRSQIEPLEEVSTEPISITSLKQTDDFFVRLNLGDHAVRAASTSPIQVDIRVGPRREVYTIKKVPITLENAAYAVTPNQVSLKVLAPPDVGKNLTAESIAVAIETKDLDLSKLPAKVKPVIQLPNTLSDTVVVREIQPSEVTVREVKEK